MGFTDIHSHILQHRPPSLREAHAAMTRKWGAERVEPLFVDNPRAVLTGEPIDVDCVPRVGKRKWYQFR